MSSYSKAIDAADDLVGIAAKIRSRLGDAQVHGITGLALDLEYAEMRVQAIKREVWPRADHTSGPAKPEGSP